MCLLHHGIFRRFSRISVWSAKLHTQHRIRSVALNFIDASVQFVVEQVCIEMVEKKLNIRQRTLFLANSDIFPNFRRGCLQILHIGYTNCIFANITYHKCTICTNELLIITIILLKSCNSYIKRISAAPAESNVKNQYRWWRLCIWIEQATRRRQMLQWQHHCLHWQFSFDSQQKASISNNKHKHSAKVLV